MNEALKSLLPAIVALIGTLVVALLGYRQWKRGQDSARSAEFRSEKQKVYKELWERIENIHVRLRTLSIDAQQFNSFLTEVNSYVLRNELFLEKDLQRLVNDYLKKLREFTVLVTRSNSKSAISALEATAEIPSEIVETLPALARVQSEANSFREQILARCRKALTDD